MRVAALACLGLATGATARAFSAPVPAASSTSHSNNEKAAGGGPFSPKDFRPFHFVSAYDESPDTKVLRFALPEGDSRCNLTCASCIVLKFTDKDGKDVVRPYTPITRVDQVGFFDVMVKKYKDSKMGTHLHGLQRGATVDIKGPFVKMPFRASQYANIGMIAGGTGIAPMYQILRTVLHAPKNSTNISLIYASRRKEDVLLGNELNELMTEFTQFSPYYILSKPPSNWMGGIGHVNKQIIKSFMPGPESSSDSIVLVCGPPGFMATVSGDKDYKATPPAQGELSGMLKEMGYPAKMVFKF